MISWRKAAVPLGRHLGRLCGVLAIAVASVSWTTQTAGAIRTHSCGTHSFRAECTDRGRPGRTCAWLWQDTTESFQAECTDRWAHCIS
ncbi:hypothetical protein JB92DRAFT_367567 [Gautieria morchelliformis]|nr:hypothetical protein JB92DRAFT_367567 [Gautieria morchelliformis]